MTVMRSHQYFFTPCDGPKGQVHGTAATRCRRFQLTPQIPVVTTRIRRLCVYAKATHSQTAIRRDLSQVLRLALPGRRVILNWILYL